MTARSGAAAALLCLVAAAAAQAAEVGRDGKGGVLQVSGFYKSLLSGFLLPPESVRAAGELASLHAQAQAAAPPGALVPPVPVVPGSASSSAHLLRLASRFRFEDQLELDVAWQLNFALASDPAFSAGNILSSTVGGVSVASAQRRLVEPGGVLARGPTYVLDQDLDRLSLKVPLPFGDLTIGRQVLSWGTGRLWNPTDVLSPFPPTAIDREVRRGFDAVRLAIALGEVTQLDLLYLPQQRVEEMGGVARFQTNVEGWDGSLSAGKYVRDLVLGADLTGDLGPFGVHAEGAYTVELLGLGSGPVSVGEHFFRGVVGGELRPHEKVLLMAEYNYNGYGTTDPSRYAAVLSSPRVVRGEVFGAGRHLAALGATYLATDLLTASLSVLGNLTDPSALVIASLECSFAQNVLLRAGGYLPFGRPPDASVYSGLTVTDVLTGSGPYRAAVASRGLRSEHGSSPFGAFLQVGVHVP